MKKDILGGVYLTVLHDTDKDLPQSFQGAHSIDNTTHTPVLRSHTQVHTPAVFLIQRS